MDIEKERIVIDYAPISLKDQLNAGLKRFPRLLFTYFTGILPILKWIYRYNTSWLIQDMIAGVTVGMLIVPQGIAYTKVANLEPQYGLYTSFVGVTLYFLFGTSKDISIGPISTVSLLVGQSIARIKIIHPDITGPEVAVTLSLFAGLVTLLVSLTRLGALVEFISEPVVAGFMTGSAITISIGQFAKLFGIKGVSTQDPDYIMFYSFFKNIPTTRLDAAFGLITLLVLYGIRWASTRISNKKPSRFTKFFFFFNIMRSALVVVVGTLISFLINRNNRNNPLIDIIEDVPAGFGAMAIPSLNLTILKEASSVLPSIVVILILEHISVAKAFSRANNYTINANQEIFAIGFSNIIGSFFGAYPSTGAFSRTAVMARSGARTPMAGVFSGAVVILALYVLTPAFYYIPESVLAAVIIHAVIDLMAGPTFLKKLWKTSITEFFIFVTSVVIACFVDIETAIYVSVGIYTLLLFYRLSHPKVVSVGRIKNIERYDTKDQQIKHDMNQSVSTDSCKNTHDPQFIYVDEEDPNFSDKIISLSDGVLIIRPTQSILYPSANHTSEYILNLVKSRTVPGAISDVKDKPWNEEPSPKQDATVALKPVLKALLLDFSSVYQMDSTAMHVFSSLQSAVKKYAGKEVEWHFCCIPNQGVRQLLIQTGFGPLSFDRLESVAVSDGSDADATMDVISKSSRYNSEEKVFQQEITEDLKPVDIYPAFHWDIETAIRSINKR